MRDFSLIGKAVDSLDVRRIERPENSGQPSLTGTDRKREACYFWSIEKGGGRERKREKRRRTIIID